MLEVNDFNAVAISLSLRRSRFVRGHMGEVTKPETINYRT